MQKYDKDIETLVKKLYQKSKKINDLLKKNDILTEEDIEIITINYRYRKDFLNKLNLLLKDDNKLDDKLVKIARENLNIEKENLAIVSKMRGEIGAKLKNIISNKAVLIYSEEWCHDN